ncbi:hypothetical protein IAD21_00824 [Abditibacteriota bacterium]|nr:hypothetical protein IAD21_00824 [Abditibacteriota bacterium]
MKPNTYKLACLSVPVVAGLMGCATLTPQTSLAQTNAQPLRPSLAVPVSSGVVPSTFRPPSVPLVVNDPYLSIWSGADRLTDTATQHWTRREHALTSLIRVDGQTFRLMGNDPATIPALRQISVQVTPTRSIYEFENDKIHVTLTFMTPMLPDDVEVMARPVTYLTWTVSTVDGKSHQVSIYDSISSQLAVNTPDQTVTWARETAGNLTALRVGTQEQPMLSPPGDDTRIDWGYAYAAAPTQTAKAVVGDSKGLTSAFIASGNLPAQDDSRMPRASNDVTPVLAFALDAGAVGDAPVSRHLMVAYDQIFAIKYFGQRLQPFWRRNGALASDLLQASERDYPTLVQRCATFDQQLTADAIKAGGAKYAQIVALAYRQAIAGTGIAADANKQPLVFTKENTSNGDIATVDVLFPMSPIFLLVNPTLAKAMVVPILDYSASPHWTFPNAPHDLGTYPVVKGRDDGGEAMPVEESANMLILCDALAQRDGNTKFFDKWWPQLSQWAKFLEQYGLDPEDQLCTDDFMGHLAHNANLSVKAIVSLAAYSDLARLHGDTKAAKKYHDLAQADAKHWMQVADAGDHSLLAFDKPGTWSQKYNMVWDKVLGLNVFPPEVAKKEIAFYIKQMQPYGVPLDSRTKIGDLDHSFFTATLADNDADFESIIAPFYAYLDSTPARQPLVDTYQVNDIRSDGMHARPVVGGAFIKMIADPTIWKKWASRDTFKAANWAPLPVSPVFSAILPTSKLAPLTWRYTTEAPPTNWMQTNFDDSLWKEGKGMFGTIGDSNTKWETPDIWIRREFTLPNGKFSNLHFSAFYDEDISIYVNGVLASKEGGYSTDYEDLDIKPEALALLKPGAKVLIAAHCHQTYGGQGIDLGLVGLPAK